MAARKSSGMRPSVYKAIERAFEPVSYSKIQLSPKVRIVDPKFDDRYPMPRNGDKITYDRRISAWRTF